MLHTHAMLSASILQCCMLHAGRLHAAACVSLLCYYMLLLDPQACKDHDIDILISIAFWLLMSYSIACAHPGLLVASNQVDSSRTQLSSL